MGSWCLGLVDVTLNVKMFIRHQILLILVLKLNNGIPTMSDYSEYQYDEPSEEIDDVESEEELLTNGGHKIVTEPQHIQAVAGDRILLPCSADVKLG